MPEIPRRSTSPPRGTAPTAPHTTVPTRSGAPGSRVHPRPVHGPARSASALRTASGRTATRLAAAGATVVAASAVVAAGAAIATAATGPAPPAPCAGVPQITDVRGDGHHPNGDVTAAWFSEAAGRLQAVIQVDVADWKPAHDDSASAGAALLFRVGGATRYVRVQTFPNGTQQYDHGTWTRAGGFVSAGATTGTVSVDAGGAVTIDVPAATGATAGSRLSGPFALTWDGASGGDLHWVDRAPGGVSPDTTETGADVVVGACGAGTGGGPGTPAGPGTPTTPGPSTAPGPTTSVAITARRLLVGGGTAKVTGKASPARAGVPVLVTTTGTRTRTTRTTTRATGAWAVAVPVTETSTVKATVEGVGSQTATIRVRSTVRIAKVARGRRGRVVVTGRVSPDLPGRVLLLRTDAVRPTATARARRGRFTVALSSPKHGRYQAVFIPTGERAERSTSNTKSIR